MSKKRAAVLAYKALTNELKLLNRYLRYFDILVGKYFSLVLIYFLRLTPRKNGQAKTQKEVKSYMKIAINWQ